MSDVILLNQETANQIAAGEVIERPASVIKEIVENSIDASASIIEVQVTRGGLGSIGVMDNGIGMSRDNALMSLRRHATSKISGPEDLNKISTLGFRGEALPSIASVSRLRMKTRTLHNLEGVQLKVEGGEIKECTRTGCPVGTDILIKDLFYNTPARRKFLKSTATEINRLSDIINRFALSYPHISFSLVSEGRQLLKTWGRGDLLEVISLIYGKEKARSFIPVDHEIEGYYLWGFTGKPNISRSNRRQQSFFVNGRLVKSPVITRALEDAYYTLLSKNNYPAAVLYLTVDPRLIDVNVHPAKIEVRFSEEKKVYQVVYDSVKKALKAQNLIPEIFIIDRERQQDQQIEQVLEQSTIYQDLKNINPESESESEYELSPKHNQHQEQAPAQEELKTQSQASNTFQSQAERTAQNQVQPSEITEKKPKEKYNDHDNDHDKESFSKRERKEDLSCHQIKVLGQFLGTYVLIQREGDLLIVDQHAAHERVVYEDLKDQVDQGLQCQEVIPISLEMPSGTEASIEENSSFWGNMGLIIEYFGNNTYILRSVPLLLKDIYNLKMIEDIIESFPGDEAALDQAREKVLITMACKAAYKANRKLDRTEMEALIQYLLNSNNPYTCPHGRPTMITLTEAQLEKNFRRRV